MGTMVTRKVGVQSQTLQKDLSLQLDLVIDTAPGNRDLKFLTRTSLERMAFLDDTFQFDIF